MSTYTHGHHESVLRSHTWRTAENSAGYLLGELRPGTSLLDVGCGPGTITADLARRVGQVTAIDTSAEVLDRARAEAAASGLAAERITFVVGDVTRLDYPDASFDVVHAHQVLQHLADPVQALREMARVCKPSGIVAARDTDYLAWAWYPELPELDEWLDLYCRVARADGGQPAAGRRMLSWARQAGLREVTTTSSTWCFATEADRAWWGGMWAERVTSSALADKALAAGYATRAQLDRIAAAWRAWADAPDGYLSIQHGELLCRVCSAGPGR